MVVCVGSPSYSAQEDCLSQGGQSCSEPRSCLYTAASQRKKMQCKYYVNNCYTVLFLLVLFFFLYYLSFFSQNIFRQWLVQSADEEPML